LKKRLTNKRGMTLVELTVAALFVSIAGLSLTIMIGQGRTMITETRHRIEVLHRVQSQMERLMYVKAINHGMLPLSENRTFSDTLVIHPSDEPSITIPLTGEVTMVPSQQTNGSGQPLFYDVSVTYSWVETNGEGVNRPCEVTLRSCY
jgi:hypothetical protein